MVMRYCGWNMLELIFISWYLSPMIMKGFLSLLFFLLSPSTRIDFSLLKKSPIIREEFHTCALLSVANVNKQTVLCTMWCIIQVQVFLIAWSFRACWADLARLLDLWESLNVLWVCVCQQEGQLSSRCSPAPSSPPSPKKRELTEGREMRLHSGEIFSLLDETVPFSSIYITEVWHKQTFLIVSKDGW